MRKQAANDSFWVEEVPPRARSGILPRISPAHSWIMGLSEGNSSVLSIAGPPLFRKEAFKTFYELPDLAVAGATTNTEDWLQHGLAVDLAQRVRGMTGRPWGILWDLLTVEDFLIEEPLKSLIDAGISLTGFYKGLWEARFLLQEDRKSDSLALVGALLRWLNGQTLSAEHHIWLEKVHIDRELSSSQERLDILLFLLALVYQNGLVDRTVFVVDGLERAVRASADRRKEMLRQIAEFTTVLVRWGRLGSATGVVFGLDPTGGTLASLKHYNERLGTLIGRSLV
jgi:hypothetical protein